MRSRQTQPEQRFGGGDNRPGLGNTKERGAGWKAESVFGAVGVRLELG